MIGLYIIIGVLVATVLLAVAAITLPKLRKYRFRSPIMKIEPRKRTKPSRKKKRKVTLSW